MSNKFTIYLADDHEVILDGLSAIINMQSDLNVTERVSNGYDLLQKAKEHQPDLFILDLDMPVMNGLELAEKLIGLNASARIIILTMHNEASLVKKLKAIGVMGYVNKTADSDELVFAIRQVLKGKTFFAQSQEKSLNSETETELSRAASLTKREREVVKLLCEGFTNVKIGETLFISPSTADNHRTNIMRKLDVHNIVELTRFCLRNNIV